MKHPLLATLVVTCANAWAQSPPQTVLVTGNPLGSSEIVSPASVLAGDQLLQRRGSSLGDTLAGLPGVSSSYFGPQANRPVIRGQDGDRIRLLSNAGASLDASGLSADHAVPIDPLVVERIELLRGPAALLYGGSAVGGVVNTIDNRIPKAPITETGGALETRFGGAASERAASALVETGGQGWALHGDAFGRRSSDLRVPGFDRPDGNGGSSRSQRVVNSAGQADGGAVGASRVGAQGYLGLSLERYRSHYGIVAEDDVSIKLRRDRMALAGEQRQLDGLFSSVRMQAASANYQHQELDAGGHVGTTFANRGSDARVEAVHRPFALGMGQLQGTLGWQWEHSRFSALGEEAFVPSTRSRQQALFALERWSFGPAAHVSLGLRAEQVSVMSAGDADHAATQFGPPLQRRFSPRSAALGGLLPLAPGWTATANLSLTERAPTSYELFANGVHAATGSYERGDTAQAMERGRNLDLALAWRNGQSQLRLGLFYNRFANYIALAATGEPDHVDDSGAALPIYAFRGVPARLQGLEAEASLPLLSAGSATSAVSSLVLDAKLDLLRGLNLATGQALPRLPPARATLGLDARGQRWTARVELQHALAQRRVPAGELATPAWTMLNLWASHELDLSGLPALLFVRLANAGNRLAYNAATVATVREKAPLPGRSLSAGMRLSF